MSFDRNKCEWVNVYPDRREVESALKRFLVIGPGYYGIGDSIKEAKRNCMREGCRAKDRMVAYAGTADLSFSSDGYVSATFMICLGEI